MVSRGSEKRPRGQPEVAVGTRRNGHGIGQLIGNDEFGDDTGQRDASDLPVGVFREPEVAVRTKLHRDPSLAVATTEGARMPSTQV